MNAKYVYYYAGAVAIGGMLGGIKRGATLQEDTQNVPPKREAQVVVQVSMPGLMESLDMPSDDMFLYSSISREYSSLDSQEKSTIDVAASTSTTPAAKFIAQLSKFRSETVKPEDRTAQIKTDWQGLIQTNPDECARIMCGILDSGTYSERAPVLQFLLRSAANFETAKFLCSHQDVIRASGLSDDLLGSLCGGLKSRGVEELKKASLELTIPTYKNGLLRAYLINAVRANPDHVGQVMEECDSDNDRLLVFERWLLDASELSSATPESCH